MDESFWSDVDYIRALNSFASPYWISKMLAEKRALEFAEEHGLDLVTIIPSLLSAPSFVRISLLTAGSIIHGSVSLKGIKGHKGHALSSKKLTDSGFEFRLEKLIKKDSKSAMSLSDSESSSHGSEYKFFRQTSRDRLLLEMLGSTRTGDSRSTWKVLIMDKVTVKVMSHSCKMSDITDQGISLVEELFKRREPLPSMDAIYFIQPSKENIVMFLSDMSGREPLYKTAFVFFSSPVPKELVNHIKSDTSVLPRIGAFREMNLEYFPIDSQAFTTDHEGALQELYGANAENSRKFDACLNVMATRIATVFASLKEFPHVRYRAAKASDASEIAPVIHEWTYDAMCHDLLDMDGNKYVLEVPSKMGGEPEKKEVILEDNDPVWLELRHAHIADASERLHDKMTNFVSKNKAAQMQSARPLQMNLPDSGTTSDAEIHYAEMVVKFQPEICKIVQALPKYKEQVEKLSLHVELARLSEEDIKVVKNMQLIVGSPVTKKATSSFSLKFDNQKTKQAARKDRTGEEETWQLFRFYPMLEELIEKVSKGQLAKNEYSCMNEPSSTVQETTTKASARSSNAPVAPEKKTPHSMRSRRTATWARPNHSDDGYSSDSVLKNTSLDLRKMGKRVFVFIIGGATRSELRVCHKLTTKLGREVVLGCTSLDDPPQYITDQNKRHHPLDLNTLKGHGDSVTGLCFSNDGRSLATACADGVVRVFKLDDASSKSFKFLRINLPAGGHPVAVAFSDDASSVVVASETHFGASLYMYGEEKAKPTNESKQQSKPPLPEIKWEHHKLHEKSAVLTLVGAAATYGSADGSTVIASCSEATDIKLWHGKTGKNLGSVDTNQLKNTMAAISPNGRFIAAAAFTADVKVWEIVYSKDGSVKEVPKVMQLKGHKSAVTWLCFTSNSEQIITTSKDGSIRIWNINVRYHLDEDPKTVKVFPIPLHDSSGATLHYDRLSLSPDGKILAATHGSTLQWLCVDTGNVLDTADKAHDGQITWIAWSPKTIPMGTGQALVLATASVDKKVKLWAAPSLHST
ncbi:hypothetical protein GH714_018621 [Hevea brasiliensis]|uniref:Uncharacterized protein n=1 Tax=Hevea brasiliensis TaxID=3981 RepID=A0A6A6L9S9_HEVBR|nr:hypothetical protein GH714_018621 [Hevea brasiliensis]